MGMTRQRRRARPGCVLALAAALVMATVVASTGGAARAAAPALPSPIGHQGRWLTDADGRVLLPHGVNLVAKVDGETPTEMGFGEDDAAWLAEHGFDVVRLGLTAGSVMPSPGVIDTAYLSSFRDTIDTLTDHGLLVLVDLHQDGWGPSLGDDGFPEWMTITHGATDTNTTFPLYYITNPAIQAAFDSFWNDEVGPGGVSLQARVGEIFDALAGMVGDNPGVLGYDLLNEPWPGTVWAPCATDPAGCPEQDAALDAYNGRMTDAIRRVDAERLVFGEPYVLFNFGAAPTNIGVPGDDPNGGMSYHLYPADPTFEPAVQDFAIGWADGTCGALLNTEWGATNDVVALDRLADELDGSLVPWIFWAYNENVVHAMTQPIGPATVNQPVVDALVRPHPRAVTGTPLSQQYDDASAVLRFVASTDRVDGGSFPAGTASEFQVATTTYPGGYQVRVEGGAVTSAPNASLLTVVADEDAEQFAVTVWPAGAPQPTPTPLPLDVPADPCPAPDQPTGPPTSSAPVVPVAALADQPAVGPSFTG